MFDNQNQISATSAQWYIRIFEEMEIPRSELLHGTDIENEWFDKTVTTISLSDYSKIISNALDIACDESLGLKVGGYIKLSDFGFWGYAIISSRTLAESADVAQQFWEILGIPVKVNRKKDTQNQTWEIQSTLYNKNSRQWIFQVEEFLSALYTAACFLANRKIQLENIALSYPKPAHEAEYREIFNCPVRFNNETDMVCISNKVLDLKTSMGNPQLFEACKKQCAELSAKLGKNDPLIESIRDIIASSSCRITRLDQVANKLCLTPRTLQRYLRKRNTTFKSILSEVRSEIAKTYLERTNLTIDQISDRIGFTETANFRRAFKKWNRISPGEFRSNAES
jgi:AraC-like DNA-binding protein